MNKLERTMTDVRQAVRAVIDAEPVGEWHSYAVGQLVARQLGLAEAWHDSFRGTNYDNQARERLHGQAMRAFNELAAEGVLVKVGRGERGPDGGTRNEARFWTPAAFKTAQQRAAEAREAAAAERERWTSIFDILTTHGFGDYIRPVANVTRSQARGLEITLDLTGWAQLLNCLPFDAQAGERYEREVTRDG